MKNIKLFEDFVDELEIPKILYHATYKPFLKSIKQYGLDSSKGKKMWDDSKDGIIYLAIDLEDAASFAESVDEVPDSYLDNIIVLHIDTDKLDRSKFFIDSNVIDNEGDTLEYHGTIPYHAIIKITKYD